MALRYRFGDVDFTQEFNKMQAAADSPGQYATSSARTMTSANIARALDENARVTGQRLAPASQPAPKTMLDSGPMPTVEMKWNTQPSSSGPSASSGGGSSMLPLLGIAITLWKIFG